MNTRRAEVHRVTGETDIAVTLTLDGTGAAEAVMCGNSLRSDILPALEAGSWGAHVPYSVTWAHEMAEAPAGHARFVELGAIAELPGWVDSLS